MSLAGIGKLKAIPLRTIKESKIRTGKEVIIIAGANGPGESTFAKDFVKKKPCDFVIENQQFG